MQVFFIKNFYSHSTNGSRLIFGRTLHPRAFGLEVAFTVVLHRKHVAKLRGRADPPADGDERSRKEDGIRHCFLRKPLANHIEAPSRLGYIQCTLVLQVLHAQVSTCNPDLYVCYLNTPVFLFSFFLFPLQKKKKKEDKKKRKIRR